ncbi:hypothetical protein [Citrobacter portucalensis]|uniref:hypothetical protein n=1 Tax=Citrobacter portucalensis TaxID=1639133 RepID=UPI003D7DDC8E
MSYDQLGREIRGNATVFKAPSQPQPVDCDPSYQPAPVPKMVLPEPAVTDDYDIAPIDQIADLQRQAMPILRSLTLKVQEAEAELAAILTSRPIDTVNIARRLVDTGVFHTDSAGKKLVYAITCNGHEHMKHLMSSGELSPANHRCIDIQKTGTSTSRIFMLHNDIKTMADLYEHPDLIAMLIPLLDSQIDAAESILAEKRQNLADFKVATKKRLQQLEKRFKSMLD